MATLLSATDTPTQLYLAAYLRQRGTSFSLGNSLNGRPAMANNCHNTYYSLINLPVYFSLIATDRMYPPAAIVEVFISK